MHSRQRLGGGSLATRLLALVIVPMAALGVFALGRVDDARMASDEADQLVEAVALQQSLSAVYAPAQVERIALEGLARVDELGVARDLVVTFSGVDFEATYGANLIKFDAALDRIVAEHAALVLPDGTMLGARLRGVRLEIQAQRDLSDAGLSRQPEVNAVFDRLDAVLSEARRQARHHDTTRITIVRDRAQLDALASVLASAGDQATAVLGGMIVPERDVSIEILTTAATHQAYLDAFAATLDEREEAELDRVRSALERPPSTMLDGVGSSEALSIDATYVLSVANHLLDQIAYLDALQDYSDGFHADVVAEADRLSAEADARSTGTQVWLSAIAVLSILVGGFIVWSTLIPLRRLSRRARAISNGELAARPLPLRGPRDVRRLTHTVNDMLTTLHRVDEQITRLASGDTTSPDAGEVPGAIGISIRESVDHLAAVTDQLQSSEQLASAIVEQAADAIWTTDRVGTIRSANHASEQLTGIRPADQVGSPLGEIVAELDGEGVVRHTDGRETRVLVAHSVIDAGPHQLIAVIARDISERTRFEQRLAHQARHDALTGLPNRFAVLEHLENLLAAGRDRVAVLFLDIDGFKSVNDTHGHAAGDRVLAEVAKRLSSWVRPSEFVARLGGDEFLIVVDDHTRLGDVPSFGYRLIQAIEQPYRDGDEIFALSASIGVSTPDPSMSALDTILQADNAVYLAKRRGRRRVEIFDAELQASIEHQAELELSLRHAVRNGELTLHLQPMFDLRTGAVDGAEALVRWERPGVGLVPPAEFIPIGERSSVIYDIERWVLTRACELAVDWRRRDATCALRIAVNISGRHLNEGDLLADVDAALAATGADPTMLEFELTETQLLEDLERATHVLDRLRAQGIRIAVDDFGTGYSSMTYLRHLPVDSIKIDRSFVSRSTEDGFDSTVIEALLTIGRTLDLGVVAEGVETEAQLDYVRARGCDRAQGYLLAMPMPINDAEKVLFGGADPVSEQVPSTSAVSSGHSPSNA